ncbi:acyltransferase [Arthrobacter sp. efr-133-TYG-118]|uniref:acyltransferase n=1 Tax=Arthrobacter sp. efr-133-TYG-118 TaxID=3040279 RepID=UPI00254AAA44|nr:acyltransferase [Arthrobacter sp. efr-133-TYG-118]
MKLLRYEGLPIGANVLATGQMLGRTAPMLLRGSLVKPWLKHSGGVLFVGRGARLKNPQLISHKGRFVVEDYAEVQGLAQHGLNFGDEVSIGRGTLIRPSSYYGGEIGVGLWVGDRSSFGAGCFIGCSGEIRIGNDVMLGPGVRLFSENHIFSDRDRTIKSQGVSREFLSIGDDVWIGSGVTITAGVKVGSGVVIAAGSVVTHDLPDNAVAAGIPAKVLRTR